MKHKKPTLVLAMLALLTTASFGVYYAVDDATAAEGSVQTAPQAMPVSVSVVQPTQVDLWKNFSGHVVAVDRSDIRPQVSGRITDILFEDGQYVKKGDTLLIIDPRPYQAALEQAEAELASATTQADLAEKEYVRAKSLIGTEAISQSLFDQRSNARTGALAAVKAAKAKVTTAQLDLDYANVKAPISGKVSRAEITVGNLVQSGANAPLLTSIVSDGDVYIDFEVDEKTYMNSVQSGSSEEKNSIPVRLMLGQNDTLYEGHVNSFDNKIDPASGTIRARAVFANEKKLLLPGMSVSVEMGEKNDAKTILISELALGTDQNRKFVYVVSDDNLAKYREVKIGESIDGQRLILSGLEAGDKVITKGIAHIRPDMFVTAEGPEQKQAETEPVQATESKTEL